MLRFGFRALCGARPRTFSTNKAITSDLIRNVAIIAHVDHGKTTLVDALLKQGGSMAAEHSVERVMDNTDLEKERGITILAKNTMVEYKGHKINIVDTPGHSDFGGEVERILSMVDCVVLLVDAVDGPMPQTRFVTQKAFAQGLNPIVLVNKIDRPGSRPDWVQNKVFDLFDSLGATNEQLDFPIVYASALQGYATMDYNLPERKNMHPLFDLILSHVPAPKVRSDLAFQMQIVFLDYSNFFGVIGIGRISRGTCRVNDSVSVCGNDGKVRPGKISKLFHHVGLKRELVDECLTAGDIIAIAGIENLTISETICAKDHPEPLPALVVDEPTISMIFQNNNSPFFGRDGKFVTSRQLRDRLMREAALNMSLRVVEVEGSDQFLVSGRGELQLGVFIETMRREGYELQVSKPQVIVRTDPATGKKQEPFEILVMDVDEELHQGLMLQKISERRGDLIALTPDGRGRVKMEYMIPARGLIGFQTEFVSMTSGTGVMTHAFDHYDESTLELQSSEIGKRSSGVLVSQSMGKTSVFALNNLQARGKLMVGAQAEVYEGMIIGIAKLESDMAVNPVKEKHLSNVRSVGHEEAMVLSTPVSLTLEAALGFINDDELVEITPKTIRLRKRILKEDERNRLARDKKNARS